MSTYTFDNITYTYSGSTASVTSSTSGIVTATILSSFVVSSVTYNVTSIGNAAFSGKTTLTSVTIPNSVSQIGQFTFLSCTGLTSVTIPNSVTTLGSNAFQGCSTLTSVTIGNSVTSIGALTFQNCIALASITIPNSVTSISNNVFQNCSTLTSITIPNSVTSIGSEIFRSCTNLTSVTLPTNVLFTTIPASAFQFCTTLPSVTIPSSVTTLGSSVFSSCSTLTSIIFPNSVRIIGSSVFAGCGSLTSVTLPTNALFTKIDVATFQGCVNLTSITIPNSVITIETNAFISCLALSSLTIPSSVTSIGNSAFSGCTALTSVTLPTNASFTTLSSSLFQSCTSLASITIPSSVTSIGNSAFASCTALTSVIIPSTVATIGNSSFLSCSNLTKVYFLRTPLLPTLGTTPFSRNPPTSVGYYYSTVTNSSTIAPFFTTLATITLPTLTSMAPFNSTSSFALVVISYANLVANGNESVDSALTYVFLVNSVSSGSLSIGATQETATPWNASTNKTIAAGTNAYWTPPDPKVLWNAFSVVIQDSLGSQTSPDVLVQVTSPYPCFLEGSKILCFENNEEVYRPVESLQKGDLVKTICHGYMPVYRMGTTKLYNPGNDYRIVNRLYKCPKENYPTLFEDLYITGCHSILVPSMTENQWENTKAVNNHVYITDNHFRLIACADEKAEPYNKEGFMNIYHIALKHHNIYMNYGIYANGLLVESCSIDYLLKYSNLKIMGQDESAVSQDFVNDSRKTIQQLVDMY